MFLISNKLDLKEETRFTYLFYQEIREKKFYKIKFSIEVKAYK